MAEQIIVKVEDLEKVGDNVKAAKVGSLLILVVDTTKEIGLSTSGKMMGNGSSGGFTSLPGGLKGNIYVGRKL